MVDPVSLLASVIAIYGLAEQLLKVAKNVYNAPRKIRTLQSEVKDLQTLAKQIESLCKENGQQISKPTSTGLSH
jgi:hypothetical protein